MTCLFLVSSVEFCVRDTPRNVEGGGGAELSFNGPQT
jgi:hypothetical protein